MIFHKKNFIANLATISFIFSQNIAIGAPLYTYHKAVKNLAVSGSSSSSGSGGTGSSTGGASSPQDTSPVEVPTATLTANTTTALGSVLLGHTATANFTVKNTSATKSLSNIQVGLTPSFTGYSVQNGCSSTLAAGASCAVSVTYTATQESNTANATLVVLSSSLTSSLSANITAITPVETPTMDVAYVTSSSIGNVLVGHTGSTSFTITNTSATKPLNALQVNLATTASGFTLQSSCGTTLAAGDGCLATVSYAPTQESDLVSASLSVQSTSVATITKEITASSLNGNPSITVSSNSGSFYDVIEGSSVDKTFTITNTTTVPVSGLTVGVSGSNFTLKSTTCTSTLSGNSTCTATIKFQPTIVSASVTGELSILGTNLTSAYTVPLTGSSVSAVSASIPNSVTLGYSLPGDQTNVQSFNVQNTSTSGMPISTSITSSSVANVFSIYAKTAQGADCSTIPAQSYCVVYVKYSPTTGNGETITGQAEVSINSTAYSIGLTGYTDGYSLPNSSVLTALADASTNWMQLITAHVSAGGVKLAKLVKNNTVYSTATGANITPSSSKNITMHFAGPAAGVYDLALFDINGHQMGYISSAVTVSSFSGAISADTSTDFGSNVGVGATKSLVFTLTNTGTGTISGISPAISGSASVTVSDSTCGTSLAAGASCKITVAYTPTAATSLTSTSLTVSSSNTTITAVSLTGSAIIPVAASTGTVAYGSVNAADTTLPTAAVVVINQSEGSLSNVSFSVQSVSDAALFTTNAKYRDTLTACPTTLVAGDYCTVNVAFAPTTTTGAKQAYIAISSQTYSNSTLVPITATVVTPTISGTLTAGTAGALTISSAGSLAQAYSVVLKSGTTVVATSSSVTINSGTNITANFAAGPAVATYTVEVRNSSGAVIANAGTTTVQTPPTPSALLMHFDSSVADNSGNAVTYTAVGSSSSISTANSKFGGASLYSDGSTYYKANSFNAAKLDFSQFNAWTIEAWVYPTSLDSKNKRIFGGAINGDMSKWEQVTLTASSSSTSLTIDYQYGVAPSTNGITISGPALTLNTWHHVAGVFNGTTYSVYIDGSLAASTSSTTKAYAASSLTNPTVTVGSNGGGYSIAGYLDELRVVTGTAMYSGSTYTVPTAAFTN